ncbi:hypothetical protein [Pseudohaliea sp.]|uniref:hypothetical protein n=1 Tax=Pseudohaliea sp. TaxID=2740289 RepID=UPI0032EF44BE
MSRYAPYALVLLKAVLLAWGLLGLVEYLVPSAAFGLQNANFPPGTQLFHWVLILLTGLVFLLGFAKRWKYTPFATITMYATLATLCFVETVDFRAFGDGAERYIVMSAEYLLYLALSAYLLSSTRIRARFSGGA